MIVFDIEANDLYDGVTEIHCIAMKADDTPTKIYTSKPLPGSDGTLAEGIEALKGNTIVGHNIINYDIPTIQKILGVDLYEFCTVIDTLIVSKLSYPNLTLVDSNRKAMPPKLRGKHSLKAWGYRLNKFKGDYGEQEEAWDKLTPEMMTYCKQDVEVNFAMLNKMKQKGLPPTKALDIEQRFARIISRQEKHGWAFDLKKAQALHVQLLEEMDKAEDALFKVFKPLRTWFPKDYPKRPLKKDGTKSQVLLNQEALGYHFNDNDEWGKWEDVVFNPGSGQHIVRWVEHLYGEQKWRRNDPTDRNPKGSPKTGADDIIALFGNKDWAKPLTNYFVVTKTLGQLAEGKNSWLNKVKNNKIHGSVDTLGAVSRRCTHNNPNVAQVPATHCDSDGNMIRGIDGRFGAECRELYTVREGYKLVGCDASGLELRTLSHYMAKYDNGDYADVVANGDIHTLNQKSAGLPTRNNAKTFIYAFLYGAGDEKIGSIVGKGKKEGKALKEKFLQTLPALKSLLEAVQKAVETRGYILALDGNPFFIRSKHSALNTLLQGCGALVMKYYNVLADDSFQAKGWVPGVDYEQVGSIHDECQWEVKEEIAEEFAKEAERVFDDVTEVLQFRIPLTGEAKIGNNWAETH